MELDFLSDDEVELRGRKERERDAVIAAAFHEIALSAQSLRVHPAKVLLPRIEQLCKECRETLGKNTCVMDFIRNLAWEKEIHFGRALGNGEYGSMGIYSKDGEHVASIYTNGQRVVIHGIGDEVLADEALSDKDWEEVSRTLVGSPS